MKPAFLRILILCSLGLCASWASAEREFPEAIGSFSTVNIEAEYTPSLRTLALRSKSIVAAPDLEDWFGAILLHAEFRAQVRVEQLQPLAPAELAEYLSLLLDFGMCRWGAQALWSNTNCLVFHGGESHIVSLNMGPGDSPTPVIHMRHFGDSEPLSQDLLRTFQQLKAAAAFLDYGDLLAIHPVPGGLKISFVKSDLKGRSLLLSGVLLSNARQTCRAKQLLSCVSAWQAEDQNRKNFNVVDVLGFLNPNSPPAR